MRAGVYPAGAVESWLERPIEGGLGYVADFGPAGAFVHGGYGEVRVHPWVDAYPQRLRPAALRLQLYGTGEVLRSPELGWGGGGSIGVGFEAAEFEQGTFGEIDPWGGFIGVVHGELGVSGAFELWFRAVPGYHWVGASIRLRMRLPAALGLLLVPIDL